MKTKNKNKQNLTKQKANLLNWVRYVKFNLEMSTCRIKWEFWIHKVLRQGGKNIQKKYWKKDLNDPDNKDGMITRLEPGILECEVKWALGSITMNKASGGDGIPAELFQILKVMLLKCCTQYSSKFWKFSHGRRTGKA